MRLICYPSNPADPNCTGFVDILINRMTYGDTIAAACLEITSREILAQKCRTPLARDILLNQIYVDDTTGGDEEKAKLMEALLDISEVLEAHGFSFKKVSQPFFFTRN